LAFAVSWRSPSCRSVRSPSCGNGSKSLTGSRWPRQSPTIRCRSSRRRATLPPSTRRDRRDCLCRLGDHRTCKQLRLLVRTERAPPARLPDGRHGAGRGSPGSPGSWWGAGWLTMSDGDRPPRWPWWDWLVSERSPTGVAARAHRRLCPRSPLGLGPCTRGRVAARRAVPDHSPCIGRRVVGGRRRPRRGRRPRDVRCRRRRRNRFAVAAVLTFLPAACFAALFWLVPETRGRSPRTSGRPRLSLWSCPTRRRMGVPQVGRQGCERRPYGPLSRDAVPSTTSAAMVPSTSSRPEGSRGSKLL